MDTLLLDRTRWDLCLDASRNIAVASDPYSIAQDAASAARTFRGEVWYDTTLGIPYFGEVLGKRPPLSLVKTQIVREAMRTPGALSGTCFLTAITPARGLSGQLQITTQQGQQVVVGF